MRLFLFLNALFLFAGKFIQCDINFNNKMASRCKEHISSKGHTYTTFYRVNTADRKFGPGVEFEMHLAILAESDGHIMLSSTENPKAQDPVYEFVVGGGGNTFSELRKLQGRASKVTARTKDILSPDTFRSFWIKITTDGLIEFGIEGARLATLSYHDLDPLPVRFFSFSTWSTIRGRFLYDCHGSQNDTDHHDTHINNTVVETAVVKDNNTDVKPELTPHQELLENITRRGRGRPDDDMTIIFVTAAVADLRFDTDSCFLEATINLVMSWVDEAISWQPEMYNGTDTLSVRNSEIWTPELVLYNSISHGVMEPSESEYSHVSSKGVATLSLRTRQQVSCAFSDETQYRWPRDEYECNFLIGPWSMQDHLIVDLLTNDSVTKYFKTAATPALSTDWDIIQVNQSIMSSHRGYRPYHGVSNSSDEAENTFIIHVSIKRKSYCYYLILSIPFTVIVALILLSLFLNPQSEYRVWFNCGMAVIICQFIIYLDSVVPSYTAPVILICYTVTMVMLSAMLLIQAILQQPWCRRLICSHPVQTTAEQLRLKTNETCDSVDDEASNCGDTTTGREIKPDNVAIKYAVLIVDRVLIGIYIAVYVTMAVFVYL